MPISNEIRLLREKLLLTQEEFARELCVSASTVNRWETGKVRPNISTMKNIKKFCKTNKYSYERIEKSWLNRE